jgi:hypothetical protein
MIPHNGSAAFTVTYLTLPTANFVLIRLSLERLNSQLLQANRISYAGLCKLNHLHCNEGCQGIFALDQAKRLQHIFKDVRKKGRFFLQAERTPAFLEAPGLAWHPPRARQHRM